MTESRPQSRGLIRCSDLDACRHPGRSATDICVQDVHRFVGFDTVTAYNLLHGVAAGTAVEAVPACRRHVEVLSRIQMPRTEVPQSIRIYIVRTCDLKSTKRVTPFTRRSCAFMVASIAAVDMPRRKPPSSDPAASPGPARSATVVRPGKTGGAGDGELWAGRAHSQRSKESCPAGGRTAWSARSWGWMW